MAMAYIGLGSNLGNREGCLREAIQRLRQLPGTTVLRVSRFYETAPVGGPPQGEFLNAALAIETTLAPEPLLAELQRIEAALGRVRDVKWGPRTIDLDILLYDDLVLDTPTLKIPHPLMHERMFVLDPLAEIAPDLVHPILEKPVAELREEISKR
ncbi:MAG: 2-amino-4-hydroxy-6-hydroxymethyldihydropteridine diphosphokinase [Planctomycetes bacterium]|nr:2-amino-4-hydroxy-6-hydroxymethyldihydropteridine diphosphokinase [Planctomycetota bacterium]MBM4082888.1 2-amino-4-hydroxy-6-hydroxymethyldihydropteridine diphosphokinase [Planctomycetota bacterium]